MAGKIRIALLGLGNVGEKFAEHFLEIMQEGGKPVEIVAVAHDDLDSPIVLGFQQNQVPVFKNPVDVIKLGAMVDIIFDLTEDPKTRQALRQGLQKSNNGHTVIAPEVVANLLWMFFGEPGNLGEGKGGGY
jgi:homoserine dehydrogenase